MICISGGGLLGQMCADNEMHPFRDYEVNDALDLKNQLMELAQLDERAQEILAHCDEYPQELLQLFVKDPDTIVKYRYFFNGINAGVMNAMAIRSSLWVDVHLPLWQWPLRDYAKMVPFNLPW